VFPKGDDEHPPLAVSWCSGRAQKVNASAKEPICQPTSSTMKLRQLQLSVPDA
jgi:hypothetical protein